MQCNDISSTSISAPLLDCSQYMNFKIHIEANMNIVPYTLICMCLPPNLVWCVTLCKKITCKNKKWSHVKA